MFTRRRVVLVSSENPSKCVPRWGVVLVLPENLSFSLLSLQQVDKNTWRGRHDESCHHNGYVALYCVREIGNNLFDADVHSGTLPRSFRSRYK